MLTIRLRCLFLTLLWIPFVHLAPAQTLHISPETKLLTYDTTLLLPGKKAEELFDRAKFWFSLQAQPGSEITWENAPVQISGKFVSSFPEGLGVFSPYHNEISLKIEDGAVTAVVDNLSTMNNGTPRGIETYFIKRNGNLRTGPMKVRFCRKMERTLNETMAGLYAQLSSTETPQPISTTTANVPSDTVARPDQQKWLYVRAGVGMLMAYDRPGNNWFLPGFTLCGGVRLVQGKNAALTISLPVTFGSIRNTFSGFDAPLMLDLGLGSAAANRRNAKVGFIAGGGMGFLYTENYYPYSDIHVWGYRTHAGLTFGNGDKGTLAVLLSYGKSTTGSLGTVFGINIEMIMPNF